MYKQLGINIFVKPINTKIETAGTNKNNKEKEIRI